MTISLEEEIEELNEIEDGLRASLTTVRAQLVEANDALNTTKANEMALKEELSALKEKVMIAYLTNACNIESVQECDGILAGALGHKVGCWALASIPQACSCGGVGK